MRILVSKPSLLMLLWLFAEGLHKERLLRSLNLVADLRPEKKKLKESATPEVEDCVPPPSI